MANNHSLQIAIRAKDMATKVISRVKRSIGGLAEHKGYQQIAGAFSTIKESVFNLKTAITGLVAAWGIADLAQKTLTAFNELQASMLGLSSVAEKMLGDIDGANGAIVSGSEAAKAAARELAADGLMTVAEASAGLKNLLLAGFGLNESTVMMNRFKDSAAFGRQAALGFGQAIVGATEGIKNENSMLVDNAGVTKNVAKMVEDHAAKLGKTTKELTDAEKRTAIYNGILAETSVMTGDAEKLTKTFAGSTAKLNASLKDLYALIGEVLAPALQAFINEQLLPIINYFKEWFKANKELLSVKLKEWLDGLIPKVLAVADALGSLFNMLYKVGKFLYDHPILVGMVAGGLKGGAMGGGIGAAVGALAGGIGGAMFESCKQEFGSDSEPINQSRQGVTFQDVTIISTDVPQGAY